MSDEFLKSYKTTYQWNHRPQHPRRPDWFRAWPNGARMALQIDVLHEWETVPWHRSRPMPATAHHKFDFMSLGAREYGARHGIWRLLDVLDRHGVKATLMCNGLTAELFPDSVRAAADRGHEIASHQWDQALFPPMIKTREEERDLLVRTRESLERVSGQRVAGYLSPGPRPTPHTLGLLAELSYDWTADYIDFDVPYFIDVDGRRIVSVGYATPGCIDFDLTPYAMPARLDTMKYIFDATYAESKTHPMRFCYAVHTHWGGTTGMAQVMDDFLAYVKSRDPNIWYPRCGDMAAFWNAEGKRAG